VATSARSARAWSGPLHERSAQRSPEIVDSLSERRERFRRFRPSMRQLLQRSADTRDGPGDARPTCGGRARRAWRQVGSNRTAISAAVGVGARRSDAKSISVVSVSWPTAEISGIGRFGGRAHHLLLVEGP
jgi:hypothetical protein